MKTVIIGLFVILIACSQNDPASPDVMNTNDTIINVKEKYLLIKYGTMTADTPVIRLSKTEILGDQELYARITSGEGVDTINFLNHISEDDIPIRHYKLTDTTLTFEIIYSTTGVRFYAGEITHDSGNNIIVRTNNYKIINQFSPRPTYFRTFFEVALPPDWKLNSIIYKWN